MGEGNLQLLFHWPLAPLNLYSPLQIQHLFLQFARVLMLLVGFPCLVLSLSKFVANGAFRLHDFLIEFLSCGIDLLTDLNGIIV